MRRERVGKLRIHVAAYTAAPRSFFRGSRGQCSATRLVTFRRIAAVIFLRILLVVYKQRAAIVVAALARAETWRKRPALFPTFMEGFCQVVDAYIAIDAKIDALDEGNQPQAN